jgi:NAD+---dinitrogen-reductase ADP-D-ribosyltransferase
MHLPESLYHENIAQDDSRSASIINRCNVPPWILGSEEFQANPRPVEIDGVRDTDGRLFHMLESIPDAVERSRLFDDYVCAKFGLHELAEQHDGKTPASYSYVHFLRAWGADSNGHAGAVLKAWVESRFGILATYHNGRLADDAQARTQFTFDRMRGAARTIGLLMQLDLLYTYCQDELRRRHPGQQWRTLYRGTHDPEEYIVKSRHAPQSSKQTLIQLNNLSSFTSDSEVAWEFGSKAWEVQIPLSKIVFFSGLLPKYLSGESEYLVLGGYYRVKTLLY